MLPQIYKDIKKILKWFVIIFLGACVIGLIAWPCVYFYVQYENSEYNKKQILDFTNNQKEIPEAKEYISKSNIIGYIYTYNEYGNKKDILVIKSDDSNGHILVNYQDKWYILYNMSDMKFICDKKYYYEYTNLIPSNDYDDIECNGSRYVYSERFILRKINNQFYEIKSHDKNSRVDFEELNDWIKTHLPPNETKTY